MSEREWKPGDVAVASYNDEVKVYLRVESRYVTDFASRWQAQDGSHSFDFSKADWWRHLVVIDPEDAEQVERLVACVYEQPADLKKRTKEHWQQALREYANPKPPIIEPTGLGAVVEDSRGRTWIRYLRPGTSAPWLWSEAPEHVERLSVWSAIDAVAVLSDGVTP